MLKEIRWRRNPDVELVLEPDRKMVVPLLRQTALERITVGSYPVGVAFDGTHIWVTNFDSNSVSKIPALPLGHP